jgi:D-alanyl-D-alanine carboxypeptidase/D-alanyl-D-alanine-endopeptidase (penicillin-binding protein 4)
VAFSILVNHFDRPVREVRPAIDAIVLQLAQLQACPDR